MHSISHRAPMFVQVHQFLENKFLPAAENLRRYDAVHVFIDQSGLKDLQPVSSIICEEEFGSF